MPPYWSGVDLQIVGQSQWRRVLEYCRTVAAGRGAVGRCKYGTLLTDGIERLRRCVMQVLSGEPVRTLIVTTFGRPGYVRPRAGRR